MLNNDNEEVGRKPVKLIYKFEPHRDAFVRVSVKSPIPLEDIELSSGK